MLPERVKQAQEALWSSEETLARLRKQYGWSDTIMHSQLLGLEGGRLLFPSQDLDGAWFYTSRRLDGTGPKYLHEYGRAPALYSHHSLYRAIYLCEGHSDTVTALDLGYPASGMLGSWAYKKAVEYLQWHRMVFTVMDADPAGMEATRKLVATLPNVRVVMLWPPGVVGWPSDYPRLNLDLTAYRMRYGDEATRDCLENPLESISSAVRPGSGAGSFSGGPEGPRGAAQDRLSASGAFLRPAASENFQSSLGYLRQRSKA